MAANALTKLSRTIFCPLLLQARLAWLLAIGCVSICFAFWAACVSGEEPEASKERTVALISTFSRHEGFQAALSDLAKTRPDTTDIRFESFQTWADPKSTETILKRLEGRTVEACVYLDPPSFALIGEKLDDRAIVLVRSKEALGEKAQHILEAKGDRGALVETTPAAEHAIEALASLLPPPPCIGVVYTHGAMRDQRFVANLKRRCQDVLPEASEFRECPISSAACKNAKAMAVALEKAFRDFPGRSILVVLPGQNTEKSAFVFRQFANEKSIGLVGIGDFPPGGAFAHVGYGPEALAKLCLIRIQEFGSPSQGTEATLERVAPDIVFDAQIARRLGYSLKTQSAISHENSK